MKVMYSVLDWGLGHATRSIPIIQELLDQGADVYLAGSGAPIALLKKEFPNLNTIDLPAYGVKYSKRSSNTTPARLWSQTPWK